uniref:Uncharacterized protein n=1 Tax=Desulfovibrio sp. U5L TaxID=596152 RepID=I2PXM5_9BACT
MHEWYGYGGYGGGIGAFLITLLILLVIFLVCREIVCWYWKINKAVELLERQNVLLERIEARLSAPAAPPAAPPLVTPPAR